MIIFEVGHGEALNIVTIDGMRILVTGNAALVGSVETLARVICEKVRCRPENGDPEYNVAKELIRGLGGRVISHKPDTIEGVIF